MFDHYYGSINFHWYMLILLFPLLLLVSIRLVVHSVKIDVYFLTKKDLIFPPFPMIDISPMYDIQYTYISWNKLIGFRRSGDHTYFSFHSFPFSFWKSCIKSKLCQIEKTKANLKLSIPILRNIKRNQEVKYDLLTGCRVVH